MAEKEYIVIDFIEGDQFKPGKIQLMTVGFKGKRCIEASQFVKDAIGVELEDKRTLTPTYYEAEINGRKEKAKKYLDICG